MYGINVSLFNMYVLTIYLIQTQMRGWGVQMSANEPKQAQPNPNGHERKPNEHRDQQMNGDKHEQVAMSLRTSQQQQAWTSSRKHKWGLVSTNRACLNEPQDKHEWGLVGMNGGCPNKWQDKCEQRCWVVTSRPPQQGQEQGRGGSRSNGNGGNVSGSSSSNCSAAVVEPYPLLPIFLPFIYLFFVVFTCI